MAIRIKTYKENKEIIKALQKINNYFLDEFPEKNAGWIGLTALFYSQVAIAHYLKVEKDLNKNFIPALKAVLWDYLNEISCYKNSGKDKK